MKIYRLNLFFIFIILLTLSSSLYVTAGEVEPLSSSEEYLFDVSAMSPTLINETPENNSLYTWRDLSGKDHYRDESGWDVSGETWYNIRHNQGGGVHSSSESYKYTGYTDVGCYYGGTCFSTTITGGEFAGGDNFQSKESFIFSNNKYGSGAATGTYFYTMTSNYEWTSSVNNNVPFEAAQKDIGSYNRMSFYFLPHPDTSPHLPQYPSNLYPHSVLDVGPRNDISGTAHFYHRIYLSGGGWWKVQIDTHPHHANNGRTAYPPINENYITNMPAYFDTLSDFYIMMTKDRPYEHGPLPYSELISKITFWDDSEPQNDETVLGLSVMWDGGTHHGELSFETKYLNQHSHGLYELRYSFSPITNSNWGAAIPVHINPYTLYGTIESTDGIFNRPNYGYGGCWVSFTLLAADVNRIESGETIYYAVMDIGQVNNTPTSKTGSECAGYSSPCGTEYASYPNDFDWDTDSVNITRIKRISYKFVPSINSMCDSSNLDPCTDPTSCQNAGGNWCAGVCQSDPCATTFNCGPIPITQVH